MPMQRSLSPDEIEALIEYARGKFEEERFRFAPVVRPVRDVLAKLDPKPAPVPSSPKRPYAPMMQRKKRR